MIVYRYMPLPEIVNFINGNFSRMGSTYNKRDESNSHHYKRGVYYLHFFKNLKDLNILLRFKKQNPNMYIARFDIPFSVLIKHTGVGYYPTSGYDADHEYIREFAIPIPKLKQEYFIDCAKNKDSFSNPEMLEDEFKQFQQALIDWSNRNEKQ